MKNISWFFPIFDEEDRVEYIFLQEQPGISNSDIYYCYHPAFEREVTDIIGGRVSYKPLSFNNSVTIKMEFNNLALKKRMKLLQKLNELSPISHYGAFIYYSFLVHKMKLIKDEEFSYSDENKKILKMEIESVTYYLKKITNDSIWNLYKNAVDKLNLVSSDLRFFNDDETFFDAAQNHLLALNSTTLSNRKDEGAMPLKLLEGDRFLEECLTKEEVKFLEGLISKYKDHPSDKIKSNCALILIILSWVEEKRTLIVPANIYSYFNALSELVNIEKEHADETMPSEALIENLSESLNHIVTIQKGIK